MDMVSAALAALGFAGYLGWRERNLMIAMLAGNAGVAASGLTHPMGGVPAFISLWFLTFYLDRNRITARAIVTAAVPYVIGAIGWGLYIRHDPQLFVKLFGANAKGRFGLASPWSALVNDSSSVI
jgi:hypothetical protein